MLKFKFRDKMIYILYRRKIDKYIQIALQIYIQIDFLNVKEVLPNSDIEISIYIYIQKKDRLIIARYIYRQVYK